LPAPKVRKNPKSEEEPIALNDSQIILRLTTEEGGQPTNVSLAAP